MTISATPLTPCFAARIDGVDVSRPVDDATWADIRSAFEEHSVLVFPRQSLNDETQIVFSRRFGNLEVTRSINPAAGTPFARQSNLDVKTGEVIPRTTGMALSSPTALNSDRSSRRDVACSLLSAASPAEGGPPSSRADGARILPCRRISSVASRGSS